MSFDFQDSADDLHDWEYPDEADGSGLDDDETSTVLCPACGAAVYEDAEQCPVCGEYLTASTDPWQGRSLSWVVLGLLGIGSTILALFLAGF